MEQISLPTIKARGMLQYHPKELEEILTGKFILVFDDGEIVTDAKETLYSSYFWGLLKLVPNPPMPKSVHVRSIMKNGPLNSKTHIELINKVYWLICDYMALPTPKHRNHITKLVYEAVNFLYNNMIVTAEAWVLSSDITDFIEIINHPEIKAMYDNAQSVFEMDRDAASAYITEYTYPAISKILDTDPSLSHNSVVKTFRAKMVNANQVMQCVGFRGFTTEVDGAIMSRPVMENFTTGLYNLYDLAAESRSAAKSLYFCESPLQDSEYFARRLQLITIYTETLYYEDCGSTEYVLWRLKPPTFKNGKLTYSGDLKFMLGKYYKDDVDGALKVITGEETHLYNTTIKLRSVTTCKHYDVHGVCSVCFGTLSDNISPDSNLGHHCAAIMTQQTTQSVISNKHLDASSEAEAVIITQELKPYFVEMQQKNGFHLNRDLKGKGISLVVSSEEAFGLADVMLVEDAADVYPIKISKIEYVKFISADGNYDSGVIAIQQQGRPAYFTTPALVAIKANGWTSDSNGNFVLSLDNFDFTRPLFKLVEMEYSFSDHSHQISGLIESKLEEIDNRAKPESAIATLTELFDLVNSKLNVHLSVLEVIIYSYTVSDLRTGDYGMGRFSATKSLGVKTGVLTRRSLGTALAYQGQNNTLTDPKSYFKSNRPSSIMDVFIMPKEVLESKRRKALR